MRGSSIAVLLALFSSATNGLVVPRQDNSTEIAASPEPEETPSLTPTEEEQPGSDGSADDSGSGQPAVEPVEQPTSGSSSSGTSPDNSPNPPPAPQPEAGSSSPSPSDSRPDSDSGGASSGDQSPVASPADNPPQSSVVASSLQINAPTDSPASPSIETAASSSSASAAASSSSAISPETSKQLDACAVVVEDGITGASQENTKACAALLDVCEESFSDNDYLARACSCVPANIGKFYHGQDIPEQDCIGGVANYRPVGTKQLAACAAVANLGQSASQADIAACSAGREACFWDVPSQLQQFQCAPATIGKYYNGEEISEADAAGTLGELDNQAANAAYDPSSGIEDLGASIAADNAKKRSAGLDFLIYGITDFSGPANPASTTCVNTCSGLLRVKTKGAICGLVPKDVNDCNNGCTEITRNMDPTWYPQLQAVARDLGCPLALSTSSSSTGQNKSGQTVGKVPSSSSSDSDPAGGEKSANSANSSGPQVQGPPAVQINGQSVSLSAAIVVLNGQTTTGYVNPTVSANGVPVVFAPQVITSNGQATTIFQGVVGPQQTMVVDAAGNTLTDVAAVSIAVFSAKDATPTYVIKPITSALDKTAVDVTLLVGAVVGCLVSLW